MKLESKHVFVTGANRGIGRALVDQLLTRGAAKVYASARRPEDRRTLAAVDPRVVPVALDVTKPDDVARLRTEVKALDVLINNAGSLRGHSLLESSREDVQQDFEVNFWGTLEVTKALAPALAEREGAILNILTLVSMASMAGIGGYSASKAAAWSMTQAMRKELGDKGITVHATYPGAVDTDMIRAFEMDKTPPAVVAANMLEALEEGVLDSFPDPMAAQAGEAWLGNPRALETMFASM